MYKLITLLFWYLVGVTNFCSGKDLSSENDEPIPNPNQIASSDTKPAVEGERIPDIGQPVRRGGIERLGLAEVAVKKCLSNIADCTSDAGIAIDQTALPTVPQVTLPNGYRYNLTLQEYNQTDAKSQCETEHRGKLASKGIRNCLNLKALYLYFGMNDEIWIGLERADDENWRWLSGEDLEDDTLWLDGEPNNYRDNEDCVTIKNGGGLNDLSCTEIRKGLCEIKV